jgi:DNA mismatch repair protein MutH
VTPSPPSSPDELIRRATRLAGRTVADVARLVGRTPSDDRTGHKGRVGDLLEAALGATAGSRCEPDFPHLGIELKTIPVDGAAAPLESTWVCHAPVDGSLEPSWSACQVRVKLACVLWIPVVGRRDQPWPERRIGAPALWTPTPEEEELLGRDYEEIAELIRLGRWDRLDASLGDALQLRPKAASSRDVTPALDQHGEWIEVGPRGFYLRRSFTRAVLTSFFPGPM